MLISIIGTHGLPARYGGFETFASHLADACVKAGIKIRVINEKDNPEFYKKIKVVDKEKSSPSKKVAIKKD